MPSDAQGTELHRRKFHHAFARRGGCRRLRFFSSAMRAVVRLFAPRFVRQLIYFTQRTKLFRGSTRNEPH
jgi:hypothetical protein